jgi:hypothetical protein
MTNTTGPFDAIAPTQTVAETVTMLKNPHAAIGWALEHLPHQLHEFFTEYKDDTDEYQWSVNMTQWVEHSRS